MKLAFQKVRAGCPAVPDPGVVKVWSSRAVRDSWPLLTGLLQCVSICGVWQVLPSCSLEGDFPWPQLHRASQGGRRVPLT